MMISGFKKTKIHKICMAMVIFIYFFKLMKSGLFLMLNLDLCSTLLLVNVMLLVLWLWLSLGDTLLVLVL